MSKSFRLIGALGAVMALVVAVSNSSSRADETLMTGIWRPATSSTSPPARAAAMMAYDAARQEVVLFGGYSPTLGYLNDTWVWDGAAWVARNPVASPPARSGADMTYDPARQEVVLFGGYSTAALWRDDTWVWDGTTWAQRNLASSPDEMVNHTMAYDAARQEVVLFDGWRVWATGKTWTWSGSTWTEESPAAHPSTRYGAVMVYDAARQEVVLFGGTEYNFAAGTSTTSDATWSWDGSTWTLEMPPHRPFARSGAAAAYDERRERMIVFGGRMESPAGALNDTWAWDGSDWLPVVANPAPPPRSSSVMAYHEAHDEIVLFGGYAGSTAYLDDTWILHAPDAGTTTTRPQILG